MFSSRKFIISANMLLHLILCCCWISVKGKTVFNRNYTLVVFTPNVIRSNIGSLDTQTLINMIEIISTRFSKILILSGSYSKDDIISKIPLAVATYNHEIRNKTDPILEVHMMYYIQNDGTGNSTSTRKLINNVLQVADNANAVFENTVTTFYFASTTDDDDYGLIENHITPAIDLFSKSTSNYKLCLYKSFSDVTGLSWYIREKKLPSISKLHCIMFAYNHPDNVEVEPDELVERHSKKFEAAKDRLLKSLKEGVGQNSLLSIGLETGFPGIAGKRDETLVKYWQLYSQWANKTNNFVVFNEAFDTHSKNEDEEKWVGRGWWRLVDKYYLSPADFEFEEKETVVLRRGKLPIDDNTDRGQLTITQALLIALIVSLIFVLVVWFYFYKQAMRHVTGPDAALRKELEDFMEIHSLTYSSNIDQSIDETNPVICKPKLEIPKDRFRIDTLHILGSGNYGVVCSAKLFLGYTEMVVAAKITKDNCPTQDLLELVNELRILSTLEGHENVIQLIGANTTDIFNGKVYVFLELCQGGLLTFLKLHKKSLLPGEKENTRMNITPGFVDLLLWSCDIACGMEFLAANKVVHADLAARNVLIGNENRAIICDFGFSRILNETQTQPSVTKAELSWRWASPESIGGNIFNEKTDVWSFGVTLWEIYTLGEVPYIDISGSNDLLRQLTNGRKLPKPLFHQHNIYEVVLTRCWNFLPTLRPTFQELVPIIRNLTVNYATVTGT